MIGDIIIWIRDFLKKETCIHEYKHVNASFRAASCPDFEECKFCGKIR